MKIIIIEDELTTATELRAIIESLDRSINVSAILTSVTAAIKWLDNNDLPDLIFADIQLGDGLSFEIFKKVQLATPVIFCTAYDEFAIQAFDSNGIDYLLKPLDKTMVKKSLEKYQRVKTHFANGDISKKLENAMRLLDTNYKQSILVHFREKIIPVKTSEIKYVYVANGKVSLQQADGGSYAANYTIDQIEEWLNPKIFFRANRQFIINREIIQDLEHYFNRRLLIKTIGDTPEKIIVSRERSQEFLRWLEQ
ncbi:LytTR family DNA-binding domain-containing protein [Mucilaginibacter sp. SMC90]|uniref:LytR/AlgR family response regulator transcription factor n=1 Tax=Mucilaginibacter sp. SMC90 TaxID=2929803 RepID=UPI001FB559EE|nr:LytTR family DNA-binding domain-containing protein [Mucilaginibacter sp. SMC90]UOE52539.1 LytTR family DNA-binding domain-containing protein [Mucilaginibacter sp. SMC90]